MGQDDHLPVSLPSPPPPRPAARREAIDAALRKFDGIEDAPVAPARRRLGWATLHRRPAGALAAAAVVAIIGIPAIQIAIRDTPPPAAEEAAPPRSAVPDQVATYRPPATREAVPAAPAQEVAKQPTPVPAPRSEPSANVAADSLGFTPVREERAKATARPPAMPAPAAPSIMAAPPPPAPPPPPPPPPPEPQAEAQTSDESIIVTGSRVNRPNVESASPVIVIDNTDDFLGRLRDALASNNRRALLGLVALPLKVGFDGDIRTYRTRRDIDREYDRIFTAEVRQSAQRLHPHTLTTRDNGRLRGNGRLWFGCGKRECTSGEALKIREIVAAP